MESHVQQVVRSISATAEAELRSIIEGRKACLAADQWQPVERKAVAPWSGVSLGNGPLRTAFERNIRYLNDWFEAKKRYAQPSEAIGWENHLPASSEGRMLSAAAHTLRWGERADMRAIVDSVVRVVKARQRDDGYCLPFDEVDMNFSAVPFTDERRNYDRVNLTRGLVAAGLAGNRDALDVVRRFQDWFNASPYASRSLAGLFDASPDHGNSLVGEGEIGTAHNGSNALQANQDVYFSPVGRREDLEGSLRYLLYDWFVDAARNREALSLSHHPCHVAHSYVLLHFLAWADQYRATGAQRLLEGVLGAWAMVHDHFLHIGGSLAICEHCQGTYPPDSHYLRVTKEHHTGETCGSVFWADINHRLLELFPGEVKYADEIEMAIYNVLLANQDEEGRIRYHARLLGEKAPSEFRNVCCEVMGSPFLARLPQYLYSIGADGIFVNLVASSAVDWSYAGQPVTLTTTTEYPMDGAVSIRFGTSGSEPIGMVLRIRVPGWVCGDVAIRVNGQVVTHGAPGRNAEIGRDWGDGDTVAFTLPMSPRVEQYRGADEDPRFGRHALLVGPVLMGLIGAEDLDVAAAELPDRLRPITGQPLHFAVEGLADEVRYKPYWLIDKEPFTCFPTMR